MRRTFRVTVGAMTNPKRFKSRKKAMTHVIMYQAMRRLAKAMEESLYRESECNCSNPYCQV